MRETLKTAVYAAAAVVLAVAAALVQPEARTPPILSDQGEPFYPGFKDPLAVKTIEVVDYDEATATARPFQVEFRNGRWIIPTHQNYPLDIGDRLVKTAAALMDLRKDMVRSDSPRDHAAFGVVDPLDPKEGSLAGRGKRVTLRDARKEVLADFIFGKPVEGKPGYRSVRVPGQKRVYAVKTDADPSARFADWVDAGILRIAASSIRKIVIHSYSLDEQLGALTGMETINLVPEGGRWKAEGLEKVNQAVVSALAATLGNLKIVDVKPKPPSLARDLREGKIEISLEAALSLRQKGFLIAQGGRLLAREGELSVELANGLVYLLRFGDVAGVENRENRYLFVTARYDASRAARYGGDGANGEQLAHSLSSRFSDWYYVISGADFARLRLRKKDLL